MADANHHQTLGYNMTTQELIEQLDQRYGNPDAKGLELIQEAIKVLRIQQEELEALMDQIK
jgi:Mlc titration factor MtfA (ptsG expression regulator)